MADLIHINRETQQTEPALARSWTVSPDGRRFTLSLRRGVRFSDGDPFDADDVLFSFQVYLDEKVASPQRDLLIVGGQPIAVRKLDQYTVQVDLAEPYAAAERLFDSIAMLPRHLLETALQGGSSGARPGPCGTPAEAFAGLGPFRFKEHLPGAANRARAQSVLLESGPRGQPAALSRPDRVHLRAERRRAGGAVPIGRGRRHHAFERHEFRRPVEGSGQSELRAARPRSRPRLHLPVLQPEQSGGESACRRLHESRRGFASCRFGRRFRGDRPRGHRSSRLSRTGHAALGSCPAGQQAVGESVAAEAGAVRSSARDSCCRRRASRGRRTARWSTRRVSPSSSPSSPTRETRNGSRSRRSFRTT